MKKSDLIDVLNTLANKISDARAHVNDADDLLRTAERELENLPSESEDIEDDVDEM